MKHFETILVQIVEYRIITISFLDTLNCSCIKVIMYSNILTNLTEIFIKHKEK